MDDKKIHRRKAINVMLQTGFGALGLATAYPMLRYILPPEAQAPESTSVSAAKVGDIKPNGSKIFKFGNSPALLVLKPGGDPLNASDYAAFTAVCSHLNCTVQYREDLEEIWCACHNGHFDLNGNVISGPPPKGLTQFRVAIKGEEIFVSSEEV